MQLYDVLFKKYKEANLEPYLVLYKEDSVNAPCIRFNPKSGLVIEMFIDPKVEIRYAVYINDDSDKDKYGRYVQHKSYELYLKGYYFISPNGGDDHIAALADIIIPEKEYSLKCHVLKILKIAQNFVKPNTVKYISEV